MMKSFVYALCGIKAALKSELHMKIHAVCAILAIILASYLKINSVEWSIILLCIGAVIALEMINTSIEAVVDMVSPNFHPLAKKAKDVAAGAVLVMAIITLICGCLIFLPKL